MSLSEHLARVTRLEELPGLARELGLEPAWHEVDLGPLLSASRDPVARAALVGRRDSFLCLGLETAGRERVVRAVCRSMASRGTVGLALGLDPVARVLAIGVAAADCPSLTVDLAEPRPMDLRKLERGIGPADSGLARAMAWAEALSGRGLGTRFFQQFRRTLDQAIGALPRTIPRRDRHALGLLQLTRVLFLYFVQDQGWLDGRTRFLREELDRRLSGRGRVHRRFLHPLFFGTLNRKPADRSRAVRDLGRIPFLNGGLFDPHALERRWPSELPDQFWRSAFDDLFEHYHFTLREGDSPAAIGPDMLGRVFEGVMDPDERRDSGAFYTPASLVDRLIAAAFDSW